MKYIGFITARLSQVCGNPTTTLRRRVGGIYHGVLPFAICKDDPEKTAATLKVHKCYARNVCVRLVNGLYEPYQALLNASMANKTVNFAGKHH